MILFDVLILAESGISVLNDLQVAKQLVYSLQVNLSLSNDNIYVSCVFGSWTVIVKKNWKNWATAQSSAELYQPLCKLQCLLPFPG